MTQDCEGLRMPERAPQRDAYDVDVVPADIDELGHVNNAVYLTWVQEAVLRHWRRVAPKEAVASHVWVALQHQIRYRHPAFLDDHILVKVALDKLAGVRAFYTTLITRGDEVLVEVQSCWCYLDAASRKPARIALEIVRRFLPEKAADSL
jgi:acyl-CoA thioester hydrolase